MLGEKMKRANKSEVSNEKKMCICNLHNTNILSNLVHCIYWIKDIN